MGTPRRPSVSMRFYAPHPHRRSLLFTEAPSITVATIGKKVTRTPPHTHTRHPAQCIYIYKMRKAKIR
eukprot:scaffold41058_cov29-Tisochrysis_lutea.AAC.3